MLIMTLFFYIYSFILLKWLSSAWLCFIFFQLKDVIIYYIEIKQLQEPQVMLPASWGIKRI